MVSIVIELFNGFIVVPLAGPGMVKLTFVLTTAEKPIPTSEVIVPNTGRIPKPVAPVGPVIPIPVGPVPPVGPVIPIPVGPVPPSRTSYSDSGRTCTPSRTSYSNSGKTCRTGRTCDSSRSGG